jgi:ABC-type microcin C transport system permease subunit YejB
MNQVISSLDEIEAKESIRKTGSGIGTDLLPMLLDYLWLIIIAFLTVLIAGFRVKKISKDGKVKNKIKELEKEKSVLTEKVKEAQKKYFEKGVISKTDYEAMLNEHSKRLDEIKNESSVLKERH